MKTISIDEMKSILSNGNAPDLIDVRTPAEFVGTHMPGARSLPLDGLDCAAVLEEHNRSKSGSPLYIVCHSGVRAIKAAEKFAGVGFDDCVVVQGGTQAWVNAGFPVERGVRKVLPLDRQLQLVMGTLVLAGVLLAHFVNSGWILLSGFAGAGLIFAGSTGICPMLSLIAAMPWNQHTPGASGGGCCAS